MKNGTKLKKKKVIKKVFFNLRCKILDLFLKMCFRDDTFSQAFKLSSKQRKEIVNVQCAFNHWKKKVNAKKHCRLYS